MKLILLFSLLYAATEVVQSFLGGSGYSAWDVMNKLNNMDSVLVKKGDLNNLMKKLEEMTAMMAMQGKEIKELKNPEDPIVADIVFIVDASYQLSESDYRMELMFVQKMVNRFKVGKSGTRAGFVFYGGNPLSGKASAFNDLILQAPLIIGDRRIDLAFEYVTNWIYQDGGARGVAQPIIFLLTSAAQYHGTSDQDPFRASQFLYESGAKIVCIGIDKYGQNRRGGLGELRRIAREPSNFYQASNFDELSQDDFVTMVFNGEPQGHYHSEENPF